jgi:hypothetical protein
MTTAASLPLPLPPFMRELPDSACLYKFWVVESTGNPEADIALGEAYARAAVAYARTLPAGAALIAFVLAEIFRRTQLRDDLDGRVEAGFITQIARLAYAGSMN